MVMIYKMVSKTAAEIEKMGFYQELAFDMQCKWLILMKGIDFEVL